MQNAKNLYILSGTDAFTRGELDNVALTEHGVCLEQAAGRHVLYGCYTSQPVNLPAFDRLVMSLTGSENLREVVAFPKAQNANCLMMQTPSDVQEEQLKMLHIRVADDEQE